MTGRVQIVDQENRLFVDSIVQSAVSGPGESDDICNKLSKKIVNLIANPA